MAKPKSLREEYPFLWAWGRMMGSLPGYVEAEMLRARELDAPKDAIFRGHDGEWHVYSEIEAWSTKRQIWGILRDAGFPARVIGPEPKLSDYPVRIVMTLERRQGAERLGVFEQDVTDVTVNTPVARLDFIKAVIENIEAARKEHGK